MYIVAESLAFIGFCLYMITVLQTNNKTLFTIAVLESFVYIFKNLILGGYSAVVVQSVGLIILILKTRDKFDGMLALSLITSQIIIGLIINTHGWIGLLPIIASSGYYFLITKVHQNENIKILLGLNLSLWAIYYWSLFDYVGSITNFGIAIITFAFVMIQKQTITRNQKQNPLD